MSSWPHVLPSSGAHLSPSCCVSLVLSSSSPLGVLPSCYPVALLVLCGHGLSFCCLLGVFMLFSFPHPFVPCCPPHVLLWPFCCPAAAVLFVLLSEAGAGAAAAHHHHNNNNPCRLNCLGSMLVVMLVCFVSLGSAPQLLHGTCLFMLDVFG